MERRRETEKKKKTYASSLNAVFSNLLLLLPASLEFLGFPFPIPLSYSSKKAPSPFGVSRGMEMESLPNGDSSASAASVAAAAAASVPSSKLSHLAESLKLEHQFLRVPLEHLKKSMRANHRIVEKEMNAVISSVAEAADRDMSKEEAVQHLSSLVSRLQGLKRKVLSHLFIIQCFLELPLDVPLLVESPKSFCVVWFECFSFLSFFFLICNIA